jgi:hypothetical protein
LLAKSQDEGKRWKDYESEDESDGESDRPQKKSDR